MKKNKAFLLESITRHVRFGFADPETITDLVCEQVEDEGWGRRF